MTLYEVTRHDSRGSYYGECILIGTLEQCTNVLKTCMDCKHDKMEIIPKGDDTTKVLISFDNRVVVYRLGKVG